MNTATTPLRTIKARRSVMESIGATSKPRH